MIYIAVKTVDATRRCPGKLPAVTGAIKPRVYLTDLAEVASSGRPNTAQSAAMTEILFAARRSS